MARRRRVAVLVDASPGSMRACRWGANVALDTETDVVLVTAVNDTATESAVRDKFSTGGDDYALSVINLFGLSRYRRYAHLNDLKNASPSLPSQNEGDRVLEHHKAQLLRCEIPEARIEKVIVHPRRNETTAKAVLRAAKKCDSIICGTRGLGALQNSLLKMVGLGSLSHEVVHNATVPVTVVPVTTPVPEMITVRQGSGGKTSLKK
jgi:nucleotide-binding universal stress UspA family protein|tara:strand:- start:2140 stop:2760 length:621 start_codon:yes stop_codon:yes gene_type:complete